jgi:hypothetical protein
MLKKFMVIVIIVTFSILTRCASVPMALKEQDSSVKSFTKPSDDKAGLYVYRNSFSGQTFTKAIYLDGFLLGKTANKTFFYNEITPGKHQLSTQSEFSDNTLSFQAEGGKNYFAKQIMKMGLFIWGAKLEMVSEEEGMSEVIKCNLANVEQTPVPKTVANSTQSQGSNTVVNPTLSYSQASSSDSIANTNYNWKIKVIKAEKHRPIQLHQQIDYIPTDFDILTKKGFDVFFERGYKYNVIVGDNSNFLIQIELENLTDGVGTFKMDPSALTLIDSSGVTFMPVGGAAEGGEYPVSFKNISASGDIKIVGKSANPQLIFEVVKNGPVKYWLITLNGKGSNYFTIFFELPDTSLPVSLVWPNNESFKINIH